MAKDTRSHLVVLCILWILLSAVGEGLVALAIDRWPLIASAEGEVTGEAIFFLLRAITPVFILVALIIVYSAIRFRAPLDDSRPAERQYGTGRLFIFGWVAISVALNLLFIYHPGTTGLLDLWAMARSSAAADPLDVQVTGKQWEWDFSLPQYDVSSVDELAVPVGRPIRFTLTSEDVIHSFWAPAWGLKKAVIPGEKRVLFITPTKVTSTADDPNTRVQCAQICGIGHPLMRSELRVVSTEDFAAWIDEKKKASEMSMPGMDMKGGGEMKGMNMKGGDQTMPGMKMKGGDDQSGMKMDGADKETGGETKGMDMQGGDQSMSGMKMQDDDGGSGMTMDKSGAMEGDSGAAGGMGMKNMPPPDTSGEAGQ